MDDGSKGAQRMTAGLDLGDKYSYLCLIDTESGEIMEEGRLRTSPEAFRRRFSSELPLRIAIEAGTHLPRASRVLETCGHEVLVANARKLRLIYANKHKTDEVDAENLARLARLDPKLLYPLKHRGEGSQAHLAIIRSRQIVACVCEGSAFSACRESRRMCCTTTGASDSMTLANTRTPGTKRPAEASRTETSLCTFSSPGSRHTSSPWIHWYIPSASSRGLPMR